MATNAIASAITAAAATTNQISPGCLAVLPLGPPRSTSNSCMAGNSGSLADDSNTSGCSAAKGSRFANDSRSFSRSRLSSPMAHLRPFAIRFPRAAFSR